ncbi:MAG: pteridine reductase [Woeseiaceae bacterium]|nr:pteridine reductase [Woeseiaceae bacterium]
MPHADPASLRNKTALVTGGAKRIGAAIVECLHDQQMRVAIHYRSSESEAAALAGRLNDRRPGSTEMFCCDLAESGNPEALIEQVIAWSGRLDLLVNNASSFYPTPLGSITEAQWTDLVDSNMKAPLFLSQAAIPALRSSSGNIVNIVDIHATKPLRNHTVYVAAKAGLAMLTRSLAKELAPEVRVNGVAPGAIIWPQQGMTDDLKQQIISQVPLGRGGRPEDIARAVLFLARDATYSSGVIIAIDGGRSAGW